MAKSYIVAGSMIVDRIIPYENPENCSLRLGGGAAYALMGTKLWTDECLVAAYSGQDFLQFFGRWMENNHFSDKGICKKFPHTNSGDVRYDAHGLYTCTDNYPEYWNFGDMPDESLLRPFLNDSVKGIHLLAIGSVENFARLDQYRNKYGFKIGLEMEPFCQGGDGPEVIKELTDKYVDFFSLNYSETKEIFPGIRDEKDALAQMCALNCPVFFRMGQKGAYMIVDHRPYYAPMIDDFGTVDPTGCGNSSTAAAFWAFCEGLPPMEISYVGAVTASINAGHMGVIEKYEPWMRDKCKQLVKQYTMGPSGAGELLL